MKFSELNLVESVQSGLRDVNFDEPTPVQEKSIPIAIEGKDIIATAQTGTGKTGAFVIPVMDRIIRGDRNGIKCLILSPTRELAQQIDEQIFAIGYHTGLTSATVIGGSDFSVQAKALKAGVDIIVATPGRLIDQKKIVNIDFSTLDCLVLDEADRMLDMGFMPDINKIISWLPKERQTLLFSATMPAEIEKLASGIMRDPVSIDIARAQAPTQVEQRAYYIKSDQKIPLVKKIFKNVSWESCIIFTSTKKGTDELQRLLKNEGVKAASIHGDRSQEERNRSLNAFKNGQVPVIVATNVIARGIDIKDVSMIINYDVPNNTDDYIHRIGRTGRYGKSGVAITFVTKRDTRLFSDIDAIKGNSVKKIRLNDSFGESSNFSWTASDNNDSTPEKNDSGNRDEHVSQRTGSANNGKLSGDDSRDGDDKQKQSKSSESSSSSDKSKRPDRRKKKKSETSNDNNSSSQQTSSGNVDDQESDDNRSKGKSVSVNKKKGSQKQSEKTATSDKSAQSRNKSNDSSNGHQKKEVSKTPSGQSQESPDVKVIKEIVNTAVIEKATERNRHIRKPSKGVWGIVKSFIPKIKRN